MAVDAGPDLFNDDNAELMVTFEIGKHKVEMYDGIDELPVARFHKYQKLLLIEAGIGSDITAFDHRLDKARRFLADGKPDKAQQELDNLRQCVNLIQQEISPKQFAFAVLVKSIDGKECKDISDDALNAVLKKLNDTPVSRLAARLDAVKKKIDTELNIYFPRLFNDSETKEYYDIVKKRTLEILNGIAAGVADPGATDAVERLTNDLILYAKPKVFAGSDGVEVQYDRQFENLCLALSEQLHVDPKKYTALEFYNAFDFLQERAKQAEKAQRRG